MLVRFLWFISMDAPQLEFDFEAANEANSSRIVFTVSTDIRPFGNRTDVIVVDGSTVRDVSLVDCDDEEVQYFNHLS